MKVNVKNGRQAYLFGYIKAGEVFYRDSHPDKFLIRTNHNDWVAVDLESGIIYHREDFDHDYEQFYIVQAEVTI